MNTELDNGFGRALSNDFGHLAVTQETKSLRVSSRVFRAPGMENFVASLRGTTSKILLVEDNRLTRIIEAKLVQKVLKVRCDQILHAKGVDEACKHLDDDRDSKSIDIIVTDYDYAQYGCAQKLLEELRTLNYVGPIIMIAAQRFADRPDFLAEQFGDGVCAVIEKPVASEDLADVFGLDTGRILQFTHSI
ncbi:hypothetical protein SCG7086_AD_00180 [Chlamydiales bacterium SCGC AG-110-P3]|nr:hypothetical protein SCG7086_AD_00180 [Chlamydiales bacterium SCGC AG-110-P3]